jgi:hypothetical protein
MPKFKYTATFSDGTIITRSSHRDYKVAWIIRQRREDSEKIKLYGEFWQRTGFASSKTLALKAIASYRIDGYPIVLEETADAVCPGPKLLEAVLNPARR